MNDDGYCHICHLKFGSQEARILNREAKYVHIHCHNKQLQLQQALLAMPAAQV